MNGAGQFLLTIGRKATDCKTSQDASNLIKQLVDFKDEGALQENGRLNNMECIATDLYGNRQYVVNKCILTTPFQWLRRSVF